MLAGVSRKKESITGASLQNSWFLTALILSFIWLQACGTNMNK